MTPDKVAIVAAINGGMQMDREGAKIPCTPDEIAEEAKRCYEAGASVIHFHGRDENKRNTLDNAVFSEIITKIRAACPVLIQTTNGSGVKINPATGELQWPSDDERLSIFDIEPRPDLYGAAAGTTDFYHPEGGYTTEVPYINSTRFMKETIKNVYERGSTVEFELVEVSAMHRLLRLAEEGVLDRHRKNIWLLHGVGFGSAPATPRQFMYSVEEGWRLFPDAIWGSVATGHHMYPFNTLGLSMGCNTVRVGFEDNIYLPDGTVGKHNGEMVEAIAKIARIYGRDPMTPDEARNMFGIKKIS
jgi:3-keto-5-aminohexanoate cleavage enzyme